MQYIISHVGTDIRYTVSALNHARNNSDRSALREAIRLGDVVQMGCICVQPIRDAQPKSALVLEMEAKESVMAELEGVKQKLAALKNQSRALCDCVPVGEDKALDKAVVAFRAFLLTL